MQVINELIEAKYEIKKVVEQDDYLLDIKEANHPVEGQSYQFEFSQMPGGYFTHISEVCKKFDLSYYVTAKESTVVLCIY